jgi:hypothetical protein
MPIVYLRNSLKEFEAIPAMIGPPGQKGEQGLPGQDGAPGKDGLNGTDGAPGPNEVTASTATTLTGLLKGNGTTVDTAMPGEDYLTPPAQLTTLPASGAALADSAEYRVADPVGTYVFAWPASSFECWLRFTTAATFSITFPSGTTYIGGAPTFNASTTYEMSVKDGVVVVQEVAAA